MEIKENNLNVNNVPQELLKSIPHEYIVIGYDANGKKDPRGLKQGYTYEKAEVLVQSGEYVAVKFDLSQTDYAVIDFDEEVELEEILNKYEICDSYIVKGNTKGYHVYIKIPDKNKLPEKFSKNIQTCMKEYTGDYLGLQVWERCDKHFQQEFNCMELQGREMLESFDRIYYVAEKFNVKKKTSSTTECNTDTAHLEKIVELIETDPFLDDRMAWMQIVTACKACGLSEAFTRSISQKSDRYTDAGFDGVWFQYEREQCTATAGTLHHYAKKSNPDEYDKLVVDPTLCPVKFSKITTNLKETDEIKKMKDDLDDMKTEKKRKMQKVIKAFEKQQLEDEYIQKKKYFEKYYFKIVGKSLFGRLSYSKVNLHSKTEMETITDNLCMSDESKFFNHWIKDASIKSYETADFLPSPQKCPKHVYNTFDGLRAEKLPDTDCTDHSIYRKQLYHLTGKDDTGLNFMLYYLAHICQKPGELPEVGVVFVSDQGTGKNIFFENFGKKVLGAEYMYQTADMDRIIGRFSQVHNKLLVIMDEVSGKDGFVNNDKIKNLITADTLPWERKGVDSIDVKNCGRSIGFTNHKGGVPFKIEHSDRRLVVYECSNDLIGDQDHFDALMEAWNDDKKVKAFYNYLMSIDLTGWRPSKNRPVTQAYKDLKEDCKPPVVQFLEELCQDYRALQETNTVLNQQDAEDDINMTSMIASDLYNRFKLWLTQNGHKSDMTSTRFGRQVKLHQGIEKVRKGTGNYYNIDYDVLENNLNEKY